MKKRGKNINLFLMEGSASGRIKCTLANWTGVVYKIPRIELDKCNERDDLKQSGVYFLFGTSDDTGEPTAYIGQAGARKNGEGILYRLKEHKRNTDGDYWTEAVVFTTSNNSLGQTEISYLENRFYNLAKEIGRYEIRNNVDPALGNVTEEKESELEEFIDYTIIVMGTLGHRIFEPLEERVSHAAEQDLTVGDEPLLFLKTQYAKATGRRTNEGFIVYQGARLRSDATPSCGESTKKLRVQYADRIQDGILQKDTLFTSPSAASSFVVYAKTSGMTMWRNERGKTLKALESQND